MCFGQTLAVHHTGMHLYYSITHLGEHTKGQKEPDIII